MTSGVISPVLTTRSARIWSVTQTDGVRGILDDLLKRIGPADTGAIV